MAVTGPAVGTITPALNSLGAPLFVPAFLRPAAYPPPAPVPPPVAGFPNALFTAPAFYTDGRPQRGLARPAGYPPSQPTFLPGQAGLCFSRDFPVYTAGARSSLSGQDWSGEGFMGTYDLNTVITLEGEFFNPVTGIFVDPTTVTLYVKNPAGVVTPISAGQLTRVSTGKYQYQLQTVSSGVWTYKWQGTGAAVAMSPDTTFTVNASTVVAG